ncbi:alpha-galactosidase [Candidatus Microgenomates bacterium]|nr:alpha-galactosidase [Candidatus Microgenomates bacterium]
MSHQIIKKIKIRGWQAISAVVPTHPFDDSSFYSPFGDDTTTAMLPKSKIKPPATGWCSWYALGTNISEEKILANARFIAKHPKDLPLKYLIIDDGWRPWGDWQSGDSAKFPRGLKPVAQDIKKLGLKPGLWIAPFIADTTSIIYREHPNWFLRDHKGKLVYAHNGFDFVPDFIWHKAYVLNYDHPEVEKYLHASLDIILGDWQFDLIKLDFLAAIYFDPHLKTPRIPHHYLRKLLTYITKTYPHVYRMIGTAPVKPCLGLADSIRISNDIVIPQLENNWPLNAIVHWQRLDQLGKNLIARKDMADFIALDPDVMVCRQTLGFSDEQILWLQTIINEVPNGLKFLGDDLPSLPWDRIQKFILPLFRF